MTEANDDAQAAKVVLGVTFTETFEVTSKVAPDRYRGQITISRLNGLDRARAGAYQARLREGVPYEQLDPYTQSVLMMLTTLYASVRTAPDWWYQIDTDPKTGKELSRTPAPELVKDIDLLWDIHGRYVAFRDTFPDAG